MISFNNIPTTTRTPGVNVEVDNSRALQGLLANPHKVLILSQKNVEANATNLGNGASLTLYQLTRESIAEGYFGTESLLHRQTRIFK